MNTKTFYRSLFLAGALIAFGAVPVLAQLEIDMGDRFQINKDGSYINFKTTLGGFPVIRGALKAYQGTIFYDPEKPENTAATIRFGADGFLTAHDKRDAQLQGEDFLDAANFPGLWFQGFETEITPGGLTLKGNLYIKNIVKPQTIQLEKPTVMRKAMNNLDLMIVKGKLALNRKDFELGTTGQWSSDPMFGEEVEIEFSFMCYSYTIDYLKAAYVKQVEGRQHAVGLIYEKVKEGGPEAGLKLVEKLSKDKEYKGDNWPTNLANIGWILMVDGYGKESLPFYQLALEKNSKHLPSLLRLGDAYTIAGDYDRALAHFEEEWSIPERARFTHIPHMIRAFSGSFELKNMK